MESRWNQLFCTFLNWMQIVSSMIKVLLQKKNEDVTLARDSQQPFNFGKIIVLWLTLGLCLADGEGTLLLRLTAGEWDLVSL